MPVRVAIYATTVMRDGRHVNVPPQTPFDYTPEELEHFENCYPGMIRRPITEVQDVTTRQVEELHREMAPTPPKPPARGARPAAAKPDDDEL